MKRDLVGEVFTRWTVVERGRDYIYPKSGKSSVRYICKCICGKGKLVHRSHLLNKTSQSCGCLNREISSTHGMSNTRAYRAWSNMIRRCDNPGPQEASYKKFGVIYDPRWKDFTEFHNDMGACPDGLELERHDSTGNYTKENCSWACETTQSTNRTIGSNNSSGRVGCTWSEQHLKWRAQLQFDNKMHEGGLYENFEDAVRAREQLEIKYLGKIKPNTTREVVCPTNVKSP